MEKAFDKDKNKIIKKIKVTSVDMKILEELNKNGRKSIRKIGKTLDQGKSKIAYRLKQLEKSELISIKPLLNTKMFELERALLLTQINDDKTEKQLIEHWNTCPFVLHVFPLLGYRYSIALVLIAPKIDDFRIFINDCEPGSSKNVFSGHILIPIVSSQLSYKFVYEKVNFLSKNSEEKFCACTGCYEFWRDYLKRTREIKY